MTPLFDGQHSTGPCTLARVALARMALAVASLAAPGAWAGGFCVAPETTFFSCDTAHGKQIALCGDAGVGLQYRFGRAPHAELAFPARPSDGLKQLLHAHYFRAGVDRVEIRFTRGTVDYVVYDYTEDGRRSAGVRVSTDAGQETDVACRGPVTSRLGELEKVLPCDADSALTGGQCPAR